MNDFCGGNSCTPSPRPFQSLSRFFNRYFDDLHAHDTAFSDRLWRELFTLLMTADSSGLSSFPLLFVLLFSAYGIPAISVGPDASSFMFLSPL